MDDGTLTSDRGARVWELGDFAEDYDARNPEGKLRGMLEEVALVADADGGATAEDAVAVISTPARGSVPFVAIVGAADELLPREQAVGGAERRGAIEGSGVSSGDGIRPSWSASCLDLNHVHGASSRRPATLPSRFLRELRDDVDDVLAAKDEDPPWAPSTGRVELAPASPWGTSSSIASAAGPSSSSRARAQRARTVVFATEGRKQLLLQYASLESLEA